MKLILSTFILSTTCLVSFTQAQPARIDFSKPGHAWMDQSGGPSQQTGYDGKSPYRGSTAERRSDMREERKDMRSDNRAEQRMERREDNVGQEQAELNRERRQWRDTRRQAQWDQGMHNGYYNSRNQWRFGQPTSQQMRQPGFAMGYRPWTRGQSLGVYNERFEELNYQDKKLTAPPRGYRWLQDDRGDYLLAAVVGGLISQVVINSPR